MMSKKTAIILILTVFIGALAALLWFYFNFNTYTKPPIVVLPTTPDTYDPFGTSPTATNTDPTLTDPGIIEPFTPVISNKFRQISLDPISGFNLVQSKDGKTLVHYILRANGNIYETFTNTTESRRLSNTTVPKVYESLWLPDGVHLVLRYLQEESEAITTFSVKINPATTTLNEFEGGIDGNFLADDISAIAINPLGDKLFYFTENLNGASGFISKPNGTNKSLLFESPLVEWAISWPKEEIITLTTKPASTLPGYLYFLNSSTGTFSKVIGDILGLTTKTNSSATAVLYSDSARTSPRLYLYDVKKTEGKLLPWNTLPEKCVWSNTDDKIIYCAVPKSFPVGDYPDMWYQGLVSFTDDIWRLNTETGAVTLVADILRENNMSVDAIDLMLDKKDNYLLFTNKTDLTLWSLDLTDIK